MELYENTGKYRKEFKILNWMFFLDIAEEPNVPFYKRRWAIKSENGMIREYLFGFHKNIKDDVVFYSIFLGPITC